MGIVLHPEYITDEMGKRISVMLPIEKYEVLTRNPGKRGRNRLSSEKTRQCAAFVGIASKSAFRAQYPKARFFVR